MQKYLILGLLLTFLLVIFAVQNAGLVTVKLWFWNVESYLALFLLISLFLGILLGIIFSLPSLNKKNKQIVQLTKKINKLKGETSPEDEM